LGQPLIGRVGLGREGQFGQLVLKSTAGHGQPVGADLARRRVTPCCSPRDG
jgi:hypothetical protein